MSKTTMPRQILVDVLVRAMPLKFVDNLMIDISQAYREAEKAMEQDALLEDTERRSVQPIYRRGLIEKKFRDRALDAGLQATTKANSRGSARYSLVRAGDVELTLSKTVSPNAVPSEADFRTQRADANNMLQQAQLFPVDVEVSPVATTYAIVVHGPSGGQKEGIDFVAGEVGFMAVGFPSPCGKRWLEAPIDLAEIRDRIAIAEQERRDQPAAAVRRKTATPTLKTQRQKKEND